MPARTDTGTANHRCHLGGRNAIGASASQIVKPHSRLPTQLRNVKIGTGRNGSARRMASALGVYTARKLLPASSRTCSASVYPNTSHQTPKR